MALAIWIAGFVDSSLVEELLKKDDIDGGGLVEHTTVLLLFPAVWFGFRTATKYRASLAHPALGIWFTLWAAGALYFAMEEISWGQWVFGWETPDAFKAINPDGETNLHNIGNLGNRTPRSLLELWIIFSGLFLCAWLSWKKSSHRIDSWLQWITPSAICIPTVLIYLGVRVAKKFDSRLGDVELREYYIACFIFLYLLSCWYRARQSATAVA